MTTTKETETKATTPTRAVIGIEMKAAVGAAAARAAAVAAVEGIAATAAASVREH